MLNKCYELSTERKCACAHECGVERACNTPRERENPKQTLLSVEPDVGLDLTALRS